jgi:hypothetical protein
MPSDLALRRRKGGAALSQKAVKEALEALSSAELKTWLGEGVIHFAIELPKGDEDCAAVAITLAKNGSRLSARAGSALMSWCVHALGGALEADVEAPDITDELGVTELAALRARAIEVLRAHEREVFEDRVLDGDDPTGSEVVDSVEEDSLLGFFAWLVEKKELALNGGVGELADLNVLADKPEDLYEALLDHEEVDDVFLSEVEFVDRLRAFRWAKK